MKRHGMFMHPRRESWLLAAALASSLACTQSNAAHEDEAKTAKEPPHPPAVPSTPASPAAPPVAAFQAFSCAEEGASDEARLAYKVGLLSLSAPADYVSLGRVAPGLDQTLAQRGEPCASASVERACKKRIEKLLERAARHADCKNEECQAVTYALVRRGGDLSLHSTPEQLRTLFGAIDTPAEAYFVAMASAGLNPFGCDAEFSAHRQVSGGYEIRTREYTKRCDPVELTEFTYRVTTDGAVQQLGRVVVSSDPERCIEG